MKIAVISDIHGNHYALGEVMEEAKRAGVEQLLVLGDIVGYYYYPDLVLEMLKEFPYEIIRGNHEGILKNILNGEVSAETVKSKYGSGHAAAMDKLNDDELNWLINLPENKVVTFDNFWFQMNHGSPFQNDEYIYPDADKNVLEKCNNPKYDFVLIGHTHYSFSYRCRYSTIINCGSVGQSRLKSGLASWSLINTKNGSFEMRSTPYDTRMLISEVEKIDPQIEYSSKILKR